jgi:hypothetical protein
MSYITLGSRGPVKGLPDTSGQNPGNWTIAFTPDIINVNLSQFEVYHMKIAGAVNTSVRLSVDLAQWDIATYGTLNAWDPAQPLIMRPGETLYYFYSDPVSDGTPPTATIWLRYDPAIAQGV